MFLLFFNKLITNFIFRYKYNYNLSHARSDSSDINMADSDKDDLDIYITNKSSNIEDELVTYLEEKRKDRR